MRVPATAGGSTSGSTGGLNFSGMTPNEQSVGSSGANFDETYLLRMNTPIPKLHD